MNEIARKRLLDVLDACRQIDLETAGFDEDMYLSVSTTTFAVNWLLMVVGEALTVAVREEPELEERLPDSRSAIGLRNRIVHGYDSVDDRVIWNIIQKHVPRIQSQIEAILEM